ncbi:MAG TPA: transcription termination/antitermination NusG family protein [Pyrinomonadaceae bacterium]|jgi:transcriptional antiterminator RfaH
MNGEAKAGELRWYVIHTKPRNEERAAINLATLDLQTFSPKIKIRCFDAYSGKSNYLSKPLFPQYIFAQFEVESMLHKVRFTRGVHSILSMDGAPTPVSEEIIEQIQAQREADGFIRIGERLKPGDRVTIKDGPMKNLLGIFEKEMKDSERVSILLTTISFQGRIMLDRSLVERVQQSH